jgi:hypothetical protein
MGGLVYILPCTDIIQGHSGTRQLTPAMAQRWHHHQPNHTQRLLICTNAATSLPTANLKRRGVVIFNEIGCPHTSELNWTAPPPKPITSAKFSCLGRYHKKIDVSIGGCHLVSLVLAPSKRICFIKSFIHSS